MIGHARQRTWLHTHTLKGYEMVTSYSAGQVHRETHPCGDANPNSSMGSDVSQLEAPFSWARSMDRLSGWGRSCFRMSEASVDCCRFILCTSVLAFSWTATTSSVFCYRMAFFSGSVVMVEARNSVSVARVGLVRARYYGFVSKPLA